MPVARLRARTDAKRQAALEAVVQMLHGVEGAEEVVVFVERRLAAARGWKFLMVDPVAFFGVVDRITGGASARSVVAVRVFSALFQFLPPDGNEVMADRATLARVAGCAPNHVTDAMRELEAIGAVYRRREGARVRYFVNPKLGTHLAGAARDKAQADAPPLRLVEGGKVPA